MSRKRSWPPKQLQRKMPFLADETAYIQETFPRMWKRGRHPALELSGLGRSAKNIQYKVQKWIKYHNFHPVFIILSIY